MSLVEKVSLSAPPSSSFQPKSQLTHLDNELQNIINSNSLTHSEKAQTYDQILKKYLELRQKSNNPFGGGHSFKEVNELCGALPPLAKTFNLKLTNFFNVFSKPQKLQLTDS